jgi:serine/threonine protein kinase
VLGPLQKILDQDRRRREKAAGSVGASNVATVFTPVRDLKGKGAGDFDDDLKALVHTGTASVEEHVQYSIVTNGGNELGLKSFGKGAVMATKLTNAVANERWLWSTLAQPQPEHVIPRLISTCVDLKALHMLISTPVGGRFADVQDAVFSKEIPMAQKEPASRFYLACAVSALAFLHTGADNNLYRALAPELLLVSRNGYLVLADFKMAKRLSTQQERTFTLCGTPEYMAPEQVNSSGHGLSADVWSLGVFLYELLAGEVPFGAPGADGQSKPDLHIYNAISAHQPGLLEYPSDFSASVKKLLEALLSPSDVERPTADAIKDEAFFSGFDWGALGSGNMPAPQSVEVAAGSGLALSLDEGLQTSFVGDTSWYDGF